MRNEPSRHPRDAAIRAAVHDAAIIGGVVEHHIVASYSGSMRAEYVRVLAGYVEDYGGMLERDGLGLVATIGETRIAITFR